MAEKPHDAVLAELERVALGDAASGRALLAKVTALRTLQRRGRPVDDVPVDDDGRFHPGGPEWWELDRGDSDAKRARWRAAWERERRFKLRRYRPWWLTVPGT